MPMDDLTNNTLIDFHLSVNASSSIEPLENEIEFVVGTDQCFAVSAKVEKGGSVYFMQNLQYLLSIKNVTQSQLAREIGTSRQAVSDWLNRDSKINVLQAYKVASFFKVSIEELFFYNLKVVQATDNVIKIDRFSMVNIPFQIKDFSGVTKFANQAFCGLLGFDQYSLNSRPLIDLIHPDDRVHVELTRKRIVEEKSMFTQVDVRYLTSSGRFRWIENYCISSPAEMQIFVFSVYSRDGGDEVVSSERINLRSVIVKELEKLEKLKSVTKKIKFVSELDTGLWLESDLNVFKCLLCSLFFQFQYIDFQSDQKREVFLKSREENGTIILSASINCKLNPARPDLSRVKKVASMLNAEAFESCAGNIYALFMVFPTSDSRSINS